MNGAVEGDGFGALWGLVIEQARLRILAEKPNETAEFLRRFPPVEHGPLVARELGITTPYVAAIEAGAACYEAIFRVQEANRIAKRLDRASDIADSIESLVMDAMRIYLPAYIDAVRKFVEAALGQLVAEDADTRKRRDEVRAYSAAAKRVLSKARETVAHGDTAYIAGIQEDGIWTPIILIGGARVETLQEMFTYGRTTNHERFGWRFGQLVKVALMALAEGEAQMDVTAKLIQRKLEAKPTKAPL